MDTTWRTSLWQQFGAAIDMLGNAVAACPDELWRARLWDDAELPAAAEFWYIVYHTLFWLDLYLSGAVEGFAPPAPFNLDELDPAGLLPERPYTRDELRVYLEHCRRKCRVTIDALTDEQAARLCEFPWGKLSFAGLLLDNMRHVQEHAAQLNLILGQQAGWSPRWVAQANPTLGVQNTEPRYKSLADIAKDLPPPTGDNVYWVSFESENGLISTWSDYADDPDEFIGKLFDRWGDFVTKILELQLQVDGWPKHANRKIDVARYNRRLLNEQGDTETSRGAFGLERDLQFALRSNIGQLEAGLRIIDDGKERITEAGRIDITAMDSNGKLVVIELKAGRAFLRAIDQVSAYMNVVAKMDKKAVRGMLIASAFSPQVRLAAQAVPNLELRRYSFQFQFHPAKS